MSEQVVTMVTPEEIKQRLATYVSVLEDIAKLTKNTIDDNVVAIVKQYEGQDWVVALLTFLLNKVFQDGKPVTAETLEAAFVEYSNK